MPGICEQPVNPGSPPSLLLKSRGYGTQVSSSVHICHWGHHMPCHCEAHTGHEQEADWMGSAASVFHGQGSLPPKEASICKSFLPLSFPLPSKQNPLAANPASVPKAVPKGPSHPAEVMAVIPLMGSKMNGTLCPKCMRQDGMGGPWGEGKCCWNSPSVGALLGPERAAALAKTCFCQQKPHFTNIQQKTRKWEENPEDDAPLLQRGREPRLRTEVFSLLNSRFK